MSHYSVHVNDGRATLSLPAGKEATSPEVARDEAVRLLIEMARARAAGGGDHLLVGVVENDASQAVYRVLLTLTCTKLE